jgi:serine/threonine protein phosphatase PrpC
MPVLFATKFDQIKLERGDVLLLMTDGVTECKYETPVISKDEIAKLCSLKPEVIVKKLMQLVFDNGAEDNASLIVFKVGG